MQGRGFRFRRQWAVGSGQWAVGSGQWAVGSGQWAVGSGQWADEINDRIFVDLVNW